MSPSDKAASDMGKQAFPVSKGSTHSRTLQKCGGFTLPLETGGVVFTRGGCGLTMGNLWDSGRRPLCQQGVNTLPAVVLSAKGAGLTRPGCSGPRMATLGTLASLPKQVEMVRLAPGVERALSQCSAGVRNTVLSARAPSTRRTYASKWNLFISWCEKQAISPVDCSVSVILDFLQHLLDSGRSPATLRVFVSALSAHRDPMGQVSVGAYSAALTPKPWRRMEIRLKSLKERLERPGDGNECGERLKEKQTEECFKRQGAEIRDLMALSSLR
ncbi:putative ryanodine receptor 2-like [Triplophysa rosa]|uniref:Ryanodine receptor 2-like n=1 Tax=Triplophysa rosa TaxID=992332 RepID=A0A9W7WM28_TRIRA|nr:putative ryanodine receptor 2-like [Triplophysa rosa]